MEENTRLTDLTRMLLSSQAFSGFLSELSASASAPSTSSLQPSRPQPQSQPSQKDVNPHQAARQLHNQQPQVGLATIPEIPVDFPLVDNTSSASSWNAGISLNNFPVYSLTGMPEGPALDIQKLSGKGHESYSFRALDVSKCDMPTIDYTQYLFEADEVAPFPSPPPINPDVEQDGTAFVLYAQPSFNPSKAITPVVPAPYRMVDAERASYPFGIVLDVDENGADAASRLALMCSQLDAVSARIAAVTSHLD